MFDRESSDHPGEPHPFLLKCFANATDGSSLERLLLKTIENFLKDEAKATRRGKLRRRLNNTLYDQDERLVEGPGDSWRLHEHAGKVWQGDLAELERAAFGIRGVEVSRWNEAGPTPKDSVSAILAVTVQVLEAAGGAVRTEDLARVLQSRFVMLDDPREVPTTDGRLETLPGEAAGADTNWDAPHETPRSSGETGAAQLKATEVDSNWVAVRAHELFATLTVCERALIPVLHDPAEWVKVCGPGRARAAAAAEALKQRLVAATRDDDNFEAVIAEILGLCIADTSSVND
jgi:hypothetical protein